MLKTLAVVQACLHSDSFRSQANRKLGGQSLLERVVRRVTDAARLDGVAVLACDAAECSVISKLVPSDVPVFVSDKPDMLARFARMLEEYQTEAVVRIHGDDLFVDPTLIDRLITAAESFSDCDYASYSSRDGRPAIASRVGVCAEWFRAKALHRANRYATDPDDRRHVTRYLYSNPKRFGVRLILAPTEINREDVRLTVANDDDWDHVLAIYDALGPEAFDWQRIAKFLNHQPAMRQRMAALNRACAES